MDSNIEMEVFCLCMGRAFGCTMSQELVWKSTHSNFMPGWYNLNGGLKFKVEFVP